MRDPLRWLALCALGFFAYELWYVHTVVSELEAMVGEAWVLIEERKND